MNIVLDGMGGDYAPHEMVKGAVQAAELIEDDKKFVKEKVGNHYRLTKSARGKMINDDFNNNVAKFKKVIPKDYKEVMEFVREKEVEGLNREEALAFAFNAKVGINQGAIMGKITGFMDYKRKDCKREDSLSRLKHWNEFDTKNECNAHT